MTAELEAADFWRRAAEHPDAPFLRYSVTLVPGELALRGDGAAARAAGRLSCCSRAWPAPGSSFAAA